MMTSILMLYLAPTCIAMLTISSQELFAELHRKNRVLKVGQITESVVRSNLRCLHQCRRTAGCLGMNIRRNNDGTLLCQLTSIQFTDDHDDDLDIWEEQHGCDFYKISHIVSDTGARKVK